MCFNDVLVAACQVLLMQPANNVIYYTKTHQILNEILKILNTNIVEQSWEVQLVL